MCLADMTADELFNMFFGTGFSSHQSSVFMRRNGRWHRSSEDDTSAQVINSISVKCYMRELFVVYRHTLDIRYSLIFLFFFFTGTA